MMPRACAGSGCSPALAAAQMFSRARHRLRVHLLGGGEPDLLIVCLPRRRPCRPGCGGCRAPSADRRRRARRAIGELVHQGADVADLDAARERDLFDLADRACRAADPASVADPRGNRKSLTTTSSSRKPTITVGVVDQRRGERAVQAGGGALHQRMRRRVELRRADRGADAADEIFLARTPLRRPPGRGASGPCRRRKKSPVLARSSMRLLGLRRADAHQRAQRRLAQLRGLAPRQPAPLPRESRRSAPSARSSRIDASAASVSSTSGKSSPNGSLSCRMRAEHRHDPRILESDQRGDHGGARLAARGLQHRVQRARGRRVVDARQRRDRGLHHAHVGARAAASASGGTAAGGADLAEHPGDLALHEPRRLARSRRRARGIAGGAELDEQRRRPLRRRAAVFALVRGQQTARPSVGRSTRASRSNAANSSARLIADPAGRLGERERAADARRWRAGRRRAPAAACALIGRGQLVDHRHAFAKRAGEQQLFDERAPCRAPSRRRGPA